MSARNFDFRNLKAIEDWRMDQAFERTKINDQASLKIKYRDSFFVILNLPSYFASCVNQQLPNLPGCCIRNPLL